MDLAMRIDNARAEALRQIEDGLILGAVFAIGGEGPMVVCGTQCRQPTERPMTEASRFDVASTGKTFTAACLAHLVMDGTLDPDEPFTNHIPEHALGKDCAVTVRDLAMHVGGFDNGKPYISADMDHFHRELYAKMPVRERLAAFEYSCWNYIILGKIVERISGMRLDDFARERLWRPLGMTHTQWDPPGPGENEVEHFHPNRPPGEHNDETCFQCPFPLGNGSCFSTGADMRLFVRDMAEQKAFRPGYYELLTTCGFDKNDHERRSFGWDMCARLRPSKLSDKTIYHSGFTGQTLCVDPEKGFSAVVLTSRTGDWEMGRAGRARIIDALY